MAIILSDEQYNKVKQIREKERRLKVDGWMCERNNTEYLTFFNFDTGNVFVTNLNGKVIERHGDFVITPDLRTFAELEGQIAKIVT